MGNYTIFGGFENPRRDGQARNFTTNVAKILDLKSSSEQIFSKNCRWVPLCFNPAFLYLFFFKDEREARKTLKAFKIKTKYSSGRFLSICGQKMSKGFLKFCDLISKLVKSYKRA